MKAIWMAMLVLLSTSCASVSNTKIKNDIAKRLFDLFDKHTSGLSDNHIANVADERQALRKPFELAVYFKQPEKKENWRWTQRDRKKIIATLSENKKIIKRTFELINTSGKLAELEGIRLMAAQQGADAVLVVQGAGEVRTDANGMAVTYIALVPMLFVNGNTVKSGFVTQAAMWDVRHSYVHLGIQAEGDWDMKRPLAFRQKERAIEKAKEESLHELEEQLLRHFKNNVLNFSSVKI